MVNKNDPAILWQKLKLSWRKALSALIPLGGFSSHNRLKIFHDGDEAFLAIHQAFLEAQDSIFLETYIFTPDRVGTWLRDALIDAAKRGVSISVLYDHFGSARLSNSFLAPMQKAGIKVLAFNPVWFWRKRGPLLFRNHRKIIVVDEKIAFCGSMNISCDYAGPLYGNDRYRDTLLRIEGPAVKDFLAITKESILESEFNPQAFKSAQLSIKKPISIFRLFFARLEALKKEPLFAQNNDDTLVQVLRSNTRRNLTHIQNSMEECINRAVNYCYFTTPYFLPYGKLKKAIIHAAKRGVDVRILTAGVSDAPLMRLASHHLYNKFLKHGVRIFEMHQKTLHAKIATIDGIFSSLGSYNLDHWSARRNLEVNITIIDSAIAEDLRKQFERDLELSYEVKLTIFSNRSFIKKILCWLSYHLMTL